MSDNAFFAVMGCTSLVGFFAWFMWQEWLIFKLKCLAAEIQERETQERKAKKESGHE